jgi:hypothetical protein
MTPDFFDTSRQNMLRAMRLWIAAGVDLADIEDEVKATASAMRQLVHLAAVERAQKRVVAQ